MKRKLVTVLPKNIRIKYEITKYGPKAILLPNDAFLKPIRASPTIEPKMKLKNNHVRTCGQLNIKPINSANLTSPKPIPLPFVIKCKNSKNKAAENPEVSLKYRLSGLDIRNVINDRASNANTIWSGIIWFSKSITNTANKPVAIRNR